MGSGQSSPERGKESMGQFLTSQAAKQQEAGRTGKKKKKADEEKKEKRKRAASSVRLKRANPPVFS